MTSIIMPRCFSFCENAAIKRAVRKNDVSRIRKLIQQGADVNSLDSEGRNVLMFAAFMGRNECLQLLIEAGSDLNVQNEDSDGKFVGFTALMYAALKNYIHCLKLLLEAGANINVKTPSGETALLYAAKKLNIVCIKLLLEAGADVSVKTSNGDTALTYAAKSFKIHKVAECVKVLVDSGADVNAKTPNGPTALTSIVYSASEVDFSDCDTSSVVECVKILVESGADITNSNCGGETALMYAASNGHLVDLLPILVKAGVDIDQQDASGMTALVYAASKSNGKCVGWLLDFGADVTKTDEEGRTALMQAVRYDDLVDLLPMLVKTGAAIDQQDSSGMNALAYAVGTGSHECVRWLLDSGASVNIRDYKGKTPLHFLMSSSCNGENSKRCLELLLRKDINVNAKDNYGMTPLMYVAQKWEETTFDLNQEGQKTMTMLLEHGSEVNAEDNRGQTALIHSLMAGPNTYSSWRLDNTSFLFDKGANISIGRLARGPISTLAGHGCDRDLTKLQIGEEVDLHVSRDIFASVIMEGKRRILQFLIVNGVIPSHSITRKSIFSRDDLFPSATSMLEMAGEGRGRLGITKYFIAICYLLSDDLKFSTNRPSGRKALLNTPTVIENLRSQPWPLVKLCFVAVSAAFGASSGRQERVKNSQLPPKLQKMLLFQEPWSRLCVHQWDKIPLTFSPEEYEKLPRPRPLLYHWPVGRTLIPCDCGECDGTMYKYEGAVECEEYEASSRLYSNSRSISSYATLSGLHYSNNFWRNSHLDPVFSFDSDFVI